MNITTRDAWSTLVVKSFDEDARTFEGIASTPTTDQMADIVEPLGAVWKLPIPMKWQHGKDPRIGADQIGEITSAVKSADGIRVKGRFWNFAAPPSLKDDYDRIWALVKAGMRGLSIGFNPIEYEPIKGTGGMRFLKWQFLELSPVTIAANQDASITSIKSFDKAARASSGTARDYPSRTTSPVASGTRSQPRSTTMKGIPDQIAAIEADRAKAQTRIDELKTKSNGDPDELDATEQQELDDLAADVISFDTKARRLHTMQGTISKATPISAATGADPDRASRARAGDFQMKSNLPCGTLFTRAVIAKARAIKAHMSMHEAAEFAAREWRDTPEVARYLKANPGTGLAGNWAEDLNVVNTVEGDFLAALRPATIVGRLPLRASAFNVKRIVQNATNTAAWVGRAAAKPVGEGDYDTVQVDQSKIADIVVLTDDQIMSSVIDSVEATRQDLVGQIAQFADEQFTDPAVAAVANINPASVTHGVTPTAASGATAADLRADLFAMLQKFSDANMGQGGVTLVMNSAAASGLAFLTNALGNPEFEGITVNGGTLRGIPLIVSDAVPHDSSGGLIIAIKSSEVFLAQNGGIRVDMSRDATIDMAGGNAPTYSLFQKNSVALRAEWWVSWKKARAQAVQYISGAAYAPAAP
jgi:hypothetical protein